jgi:O-antigen/teichoic acid export membrane protein
MGYAAQIAVAFFLTPFVLNSLGDSRYGIWVLVTGLTGYYGLLDLGFRSGITQYMTRHLVGRDFEELNRSASTAFAALASCGVIVFLASLIAAWLAPTIFTVPPDTIWETRWCIIIIGLSVAVQFACFPYSAVFTATQRYDLATLIGIPALLTSALAIIVTLMLGYGLVGLSVASASVELLAYAVRWRVAHRILPKLHISLRLANARSFWPITTYGFWMALVNGAQQLTSYSEVVVLGLLMPVAAIAPFVVAARVAMCFDQFFRPLTIVLYPTATHLDASGDTQALRSMYLTGTRLLFVLSIPAAIIGAIWANDFFCLWVGPRLAEGREYTSVTVLFCILLVTAIPAISQKIGFQILTGCRRVTQVATIVVCESFANVALSVYLIRSLGLLGAVLGTMIPSLISHVVIYPWFICRFLNISGGTYLAKVFPRPLIVAVLFAGPLILARHAISPATSWSGLGVVGLLASSFALILIVTVGLDASERRRFVIDPLRRVAQKCFRRGTVEVPATADDAINTSDSM